MSNALPLRDDEPASPVPVVLLTPSSAAADLLQRALSDRLESEDLRIEVSEAEPGEAIATARRDFGGAPLGYVAEDEVAALEALASGADETLVWPARDAATIQGLFDRTKLRASLRREQERQNASIVHGEKLAALGTLVAGVAHEINNPLTALQLSVEACASLLTPEDPADVVASPQEAAQLVSEMLGAVESIANVVRDLRVFARSDARREELQLLDVSEVIDQALRLAGRDVRTVARIERDYSRNLPKILVPHGRLTQVLINVLVNAAHAIREVARPAHCIRISTRTDEDFVAISISDTGPGIAPHTLVHIFDPFFTTKRAGYGTGLGLSISRSIMYDLGGDLIVESVHGSGATFVLLLPIPDAASVQSASQRQRRSGSGRTRTEPKRSVLMIDDDERVLSAYARALGRSCDVMLATDGLEAIALLSSGSTPDAIISELLLPDSDGASLLSWLERERPELARRLMFISAEATQQRYDAFLSARRCTVLTKPVTAGELLSALNDLTESGVNGQNPAHLAPALREEL